MAESREPPIANIGWSLLVGIGVIEALFAVVVLGGIWLIFRGSGTSVDPSAIQKVLDDQVAAWNRGDLDGFMAGYWNHPDLTFCSGDTVTKGWQPTLDRYRQRYQAESKAMGTLTFSDINIEPLTEHMAFARGRWKLIMPDDSSPQGLFTLLFQRIDKQWRVIYDHTSAKSP